MGLDHGMRSRFTNDLNRPFDVGTILDLDARAPNVAHQTAAIAQLYSVARLDVAFHCAEEDNVLRLNPGLNIRLRSNGQCMLWKRDVASYFAIHDHVLAARDLSNDVNGTAQLIWGPRSGIGCRARSIGAAVLWRRIKFREG